MMNKAATLELRLSGEVEQREDRWAFWSQEFGFFAYGDSADGAEKAFRDALMEFLNSFESDDKLREYLDKKGVYHRFARRAHPSSSESKHFERQFEVPLVAAT